MCTRVARHLGVPNVIGIDLVPERLERSRARGVTTIDLTAHGKELGDVVRGLTGGRGADAVIDAVGMEAHGSPVGRAAHEVIGWLPDAVAAPMMKAVGLDRLGALYAAIDVVRRGGTISVSGVYGGAADPMPLLTMFDKQIQLRMGQANVWRWVPDILPLLADPNERDGDPTASTSTAPARCSVRWSPRAWAGSSTPPPSGCTRPAPPHRWTSPGPTRGSGRRCTAGRRS